MSILRSDFVYRDASGAISPRLAALAGRAPRWSPIYAARQLAGEATWPLSPIDGIVKVDRATAAGAELPLADAIAAALPKECCVALSGGLDSQLLALFAKQRGHFVRGLCLRTRVGDYCEAQSAIAFAERLGIELVVVDAPPFSDALDAFLACVETPIYNWHPLSKWLLAAAARQLGIACLVSGDGADQVLRQDPECDLFWLTQRCFAANAVELVTPLASPAMVSFARSCGPFAHKEPLLALASSLGLLAPQKRACSFPMGAAPNEVFAQTQRRLAELWRSDACAA